MDGSIVETALLPFSEAISATSLHAALESVQTSGTCQALVSMLTKQLLTDHSLTVGM